VPRDAGKRASGEARGQPTEAMLADLKNLGLL
jgi:hypothetical protein